MSKVLIIEDEVSIADLEKDYLELSGFEVEVENSGDIGLERARREEFDMFILDLMLPGVDGFEICKQIRQEKNTPILMVSAKKDDIDKIRGLGLGADDYITKPFGVMELISRVRALLRRSGEDKGEKSLTIGKIILDGERHAVYVGGVLCELTYKEYELLRLLMQRAGIVTTREEILNHVWGSDFQGESRTLDMHIKTLRQKLGEAGGMIRTVRSVGYFLENDGSV